MVAPEPGAETGEDRPPERAKVAQARPLAFQQRHLGGEAGIDRFLAVAGAGRINAPDPCGGKPVSRADFAAAMLDTGLI